MSKKTLTIGFLDVLTGFVCAAAMLMIIIVYAKPSSGDVAGGSSAFLYYQVKISGKPTLISGAQFQFIIERPNQSGISESFLSEDLYTYDPSSFIVFENNSNDILAWGPASVDDGIVYSIYCSSLYKDGKWKIGLLYANNVLLDGQFGLNRKQRVEVDSTKLKVDVFVKTLNTDTIFHQSELRFGSIDTVWVAN